MDLLKSVRTWSTEQRAFEYLFSQVEETKEIQCPSCNSTEYFLMNPKRLKEIKVHPFPQNRKIEHSCFIGRSQVQGYAYIPILVNKNHKPYHKNPL